MSTSTVAGAAAAQPAFLSKERIIAKPGFNRWLVPPAALAIHLCIGMAYGFSVFWLPLSKALGITTPVACAPDMGFIAQVFSSQCDWPISMLGWIYTLFSSSWAARQRSGAAGWNMPGHARPVSSRRCAGVVAC